MRDKQQLQPPFRLPTLRTRFTVAAMASAILALAAFPAFASAATQTLTVEKAGTGTGTVASSPAGINCGATCSAPFTEGATVALTGTPGPNTTAVAWSGCAKVNLEDECFVTMSAAKTVKATFNPIQRPLTVAKKGTGTGTVTSTPAGIECGATCTAAFTQGTVVTLTAVSGANTEAVSWSGCGSISEGKCTVTMSAAKSVTATFDLEKHQLTVSRDGSGTGTVKSSPAGIECGASCTAAFDHGATVTLTGAPGPNAEAAKWSGCTSVDGEDRCLVTMSAAKEVTATFSLRPQLKVAKVGPGTGTVTSTPAGIGCGPTCTAGFDKESTVTLESVSGLNSEAALWSGCDNVVAENKCEVKISAARAVTATYGPKAGVPVYTVTVQGAGNGKGTVTSSPAGIDCGSTCAIEVVAKATLKLTATPAEGSVFSHWSGGGCSGSGTCEKSITTTRTVKAVFTLAGTRTLAIGLAGTGAGSVKSKAAGIDCSSSCSPQVAAGKKVTLSAKPTAGSTFAGWSGACSGIGPCKVTMSEAHSVTATFAQVPVPVPGIASIANKAKVKGSKALVGIHCNGPNSCRGALKLTAKLKGKSVTIGAATFSLAPGSSTVLKVTLSAKARKALKASGKLKVRVSGVGIASPHAVKLKA